MEQHACGVTQRWAATLGSNIAPHIMDSNFLKGYVLRHSLAADQVSEALGWVRHLREEGDEVKGDERGVHSMLTNDFPRRYVVHPRFERFPA